MPTSRLAPSPTGALHLGNARTFLINWLLARQNGWRLLMRMEDLDGPRVKKGADAQALDDLRWLGFDWDGPVIYQSSRSDKYRAAIDDLLARKLAYPCICTRREVELAASAPHADDALQIYPGTCRGQFSSVEDAKKQTGREPAIRFRVNGEVVEFDDEFLGLQRFNADPSLGDFVIAKSDGTASYQIAVVIDDAEMGVNTIVRGDDLLDSAARQILLYRALNMSNRIPRYYHLPLVVGRDGKRLAKRHGDTRLSFYRDNGVTSQRILALLARWSGMNVGDEVEAPTLVSQFDLSRVSKQPIVLSEMDERWLMDKSS